MKEIYDPQKANQKKKLHRRYASFRGKKIVLVDGLRDFVEKNLLDGQSPEAISGRIKYQEKDLTNISKNTIYRFLRSVYGKIVGMQLKKKKRRKRRKKVTELEDRDFVDKRPEYIKNRERVGDVEADFIVSGRSGKGVLLGVVDRKLRIVFLEIIHTVTIDEVHLSFGRIKKKFPEMKTLTIDNDLLFKMHKTLEKILKVKIYFCHPYSSWEKGSIENVNKFIRKFIPKGSNLLNYDKEFISLIQKKGNKRFMKCLDYKSPLEKLNEYRKKEKSIKKQLISCEV